MYLFSERFGAQYETGVGTVSDLRNHLAFQCFIDHCPPGTLTLVLIVSQLQVQAVR